jgi:hypothetical protein
MHPGNDEPIKCSTGVPPIPGILESPEKVTCQLPLSNCYDIHLHRRTFWPQVSEVSVTFMGLEKANPLQLGKIKWTWRATSGCQKWMFDIPGLTALRKNAWQWFCWFVYA